MRAIKHTLILKPQGDIFCGSANCYELHYLLKNTSTFHLKCFDPKKTEWNDMPRITLSKVGSEVSIGILWWANSVIRLALVRIIGYWNCILSLDYLRVASNLHYANPNTSDMKNERVNLLEVFGGNTVLRVEKQFWGLIESELICFRLDLVHWYFTF